MGDKKMTKPPAKLNDKTDKNILTLTGIVDGDESTVRPTIKVGHLEVEWIHSRLGVGRVVDSVGGLGVQVTS